MNSPVLYTQIIYRMAQLRLQSTERLLFCSHPEHENTDAANSYTVVASGTDSSVYDINIEPDDIEVFDTVTVIWEIG